MGLLEECFNKYEIAVLFLLYNAGRELTTSQIASKSGLSWATAKKYMDILEEEGYIYKRTEGNRFYWIYCSHYKALSDDEKEKWVDYIQTPVPTEPFLQKPQKKYIQMTFG
jgi:predicted transcriptional regulator